MRWASRSRLQEVRTGGVPQLRDDPRQPSTLRTHATSVPQPRHVVGRRGATRLDSLNPGIKAEFADKTDDELRDLVKEQYNAWVAATLQVVQ